MSEGFNKFTPLILDGDPNPESMGVMGLHLESIGLNLLKSNYCLRNATKTKNIIGHKSPWGE